MFKFVLASMLLTSTLAYAELCTEQDSMKGDMALAEMHESGISQALAQIHVGMATSDCLDAYSLQETAGKTYKRDAPRPFCGLAFILSSDKQLAKDQANWILENLGASYKLKNGWSIRFCSRVTKTGVGPR